MQSPSSRIPLCDTHATTTTTTPHPLPGRGQECTPARLEEIKGLLLSIYLEYSPEKVSKIDRLLHKYLGREEEFLRFVRHKYGIPPPLPPAAGGALAAAAKAAEAGPGQGRGADGAASEATSVNGGYGYGGATPSTLSNSGAPSTGPASARRYRRPPKRRRPVTRVCSPRTPSLQGQPLC